MCKIYSDSDHLRALTWAKKIMAIEKLGGKCNHCDCTEILVLEFHHLRDKDVCVSRLLSHTNSQINKEIAKCILLCRNCHSELHYPSVKRSKVKLLELKGGKECIECGYAPSYFSSLDFHHIDPSKKKFRLSEVSISPKTTTSRLEVIKEELGKCVILCKNCHAKEHIKMDLFNRLKPLIDYKVENHIEHKSPEPNRKEQLKIKGSKYRNKLAKWLWLWRRSRNISRLSKELGVKSNMLSNNLMQSKIYREIRSEISKPTSKYKGVHWDRSRESWASSIKVNGKSKNLGKFATEEDAHEAFENYKKLII